jgi:hypothetical protein
MKPLISRFSLTDEETEALVDHEARPYSYLTMRCNENPIVLLNRRSKR